MNLAAIFIAVSSSLALPPGLLEALCYVESAHKPRSINKNDGVGHSYGVCQIKLATAEEMGFQGKIKDLMKPEVNIAYAGKYLDFQIKRYHGNIRKGICAYNRGHTTKSGNSKYVRKVIKEWGKRRVYYRQL